MKKRAMKKWIPKNTPYCGSCKWRHYIYMICYHRSPEDFKPFSDAAKIVVKKCEFENSCKEKECWNQKRMSSCCMVPVYKCDYLGLIDTEGNTLLFDGCKECWVSYG